MAASNPYNQYKEQSIMTMTPGELIIVLYEECIKMLNYAVYYIEEKKDMEEAEKAIKKVQRIIHYLDGILDYKYEISTNLHMLYDYFIRTLVQANIRKRAEVLKPLIPMITELKDSFQQAEKKVHMK
ncbi:MAG: flagellar export chaperone FliS [Oscillospiraceae bacterium]|nr:flagellar export chaperone FliS [Oscillospiraceae bacterium]